MVKELSLILPVLHPDEAFVARIEKAARDISLWANDFEIIAVSDGTPWPSAARDAAQRIPQLSLEALPSHRGKFGAVKLGMSKATGRCCVFTDSDLPYGTDVIRYIHKLVVERGYQVAFGDRTLPDSEYAVHLPISRAVSTHVFGFLVRTLITGGLFDTQCGVKGFSREVAKALFPLVGHEGFAGDVELLYIALKYNLEMRRIPVKLKRSGPSTVSVVKDGLQMLSALPSFKLNWLRGIYASEELKRLGTQTY